MTDADPAEKLVAVHPPQDGLRHIPRRPLAFRVGPGDERVDVVAKPAGFGEPVAVKITMPTLGLELGDRSEV